MHRQGLHYGLGNLDALSRRVGSDENMCRSVTAIERSTYLYACSPRLELDRVALHTKETAGL